jgi:hypothetical protein
VTDQNISLKTYRQIFASQADEEVCWWYFGSVYAELPGLPQIPVMQTATIMVYRTETISDEEVRIYYREIGYFRDPVTGLIATNWLNPLSGDTVQAAQTFREGPSCYTIRQTADGISLSLEQAHAKIGGLDASMRRVGNRVLLTQNEYKERGFPLPDGTMSAATSNGATTLTFFAAADDLDSGAPNVASTGTYRFTLDRLPAWMGFSNASGQATVLGVIHKATTTDKVNAESWKIFNERFPDFFRGEAVAPAWS